jgi:hypothetical protein
VPSPEGSFEKYCQPLLDVSDVIDVSQRGIGPSTPTMTIDRALTPAPPDQAINSSKWVSIF